MKKPTVYFQPLNVLIITIITSLALLSFTHTAQMQAKSPYDKERLLKVVKLNALSTQEVVQAIESRGVSFRLTAEIEDEFQQAGARPELITAMRNNYRGAAPTTPTQPANNPPPTTTKPATNVPAGPPLSEQEVITLLQSGVGASRVEQFVETRGVTFDLTPDASRKITAAGGSNALLGAIIKHAPADTTNRPNRSNVVPSQPKNVPHGPDYEELTDQAISAMQANNVVSATRALNQAITLDPARPTAYQLLGFAELYGNQNITAAEAAMRKALERNGSATFRVYHDHGDYFKTASQGTLFITRAGVTYKADNGRDTFEAVKAKIKEVDTNDFVGMQYGAFHLKIYQDEAKKKTRTFNFAPLTQRKEEAKLIMTLIQSY